VWYYDGVLKDTTKANKTPKGVLNMKYFVIATHWDDNRKAQVKYIAGQFDNYMNASLFKKAYNEYYSTNAVIVEDFALING
jgi:hypothetical protein